MKALSLIICSLSFALPAQAMHRGAPIKAATIKIVPIQIGTAGLAPLSPVTLTPKSLAVGDQMPQIRIDIAQPMQSTVLGPAMALTPKALAVAPAARLITIEEVAQGQPLLPGDTPVPAISEDLPVPAPAKPEGLLALLRRALGITGPLSDPTSQRWTSTFDGSK
jgi:hypothetical protein